MSKPRFLADENIAAPIVEALRTAGWDTEYVTETMPGINDDAVLQWARTENRILLTEDKDFGELAFRLKRDNPGVLMLRLPGGHWAQHWARLRAVLDQYACRLEGRFVVVQTEKVRVRPNV